MVIIFEQDTEDHGSGRFLWRPSWFVGNWDRGRCWRLAWGMWSISGYPSRGLRKFMDHIESGRTEWRHTSPDAGRGGSGEEG